MRGLSIPAMPMQRITHLLQCSVAASAMITGLWAGIAHAEDAPVAAPATQGLTDIVVTASKRETNVQKTPLAITAISADTLATQHVVDAVDLNGMVPSLVLTTSEGFERNLAIRGIGFNVPQNDSAQPSVSYHVDGIYIANPVALNTGFLDVDHLEVVRGPQGTVYGQNSTGGTLNLVTVQPKLGKWAGFAKVDTGSFALGQFEGALNIPLGQSAAVRIAGEVVHHDGYAKATQVPGTHGDYGLSDENSQHGRITFLFEPSPKLSLTLRGEIAHAHNHNAEGKSIYDPDPDPWRQTSDWPGYIDYDNALVSGSLKYDMGWASLKAMGSYQMVRQNGSINEDGLDLTNAIKAYGVPGFSDVHDLEYLYHRSAARTAEVDIASPTGQRLEWIAGAFYLSSKYDVAYDQYAVSSYPVTGQPTSLLNQTSPAVTDAANLGVAGPNGFYFPYFYSISFLTRESYSLYGQGTFHVTDALRVTGGLRYTHDHNTTDICDYACSASTFVEQTNTAWTGKIGVEYDLAPRTMLYASYSTGFKPGGGNISPAPILLGFTYKPETIKSYEAGLKSTLLGGKLRLNMAGFYYDYSNLQFEAEDAVAYQGGVDNIPKLKVYGFEAEANAILPYGFRFDGSVTVEDSKITSHYLVLDNVRGYAIDKQIFASGQSVFYDPGRANDITARTAAFFDVYGNAAPNLPKATAQGTLSHTSALAGGSSFTASVQGQYRASYINSAYGDIVVNGVHVYRSPAYNLWNAFLVYQPTWQQVKFSLAVKNVFNSAAVLGRFTNQFGGEITQQYTPPRQFIVSAGYKF